MVTVNPSRFRNVIFDILPGSEAGTFVVKARFLGVEMEEFLLKYQVPKFLNVNKAEWMLGSFTCVSLLQLISSEPAVELSSQVCVCVCVC